MSHNIPFIFISAPSSSSDFDVPVPCYECSMLGDGISCQDCSRFTATTPVAPPPSPASVFAFSFDFSSSLRGALPTPETPFTPADFPSAIKQSCWTLSNPATGEPSTKTSRFDWSEMTLSIDENPFESFLSDTDEYTSSCASSCCDSCISDTESDPYHKVPKLNCLFCSMIPYGVVCTNCHQIQTSRATVLSTPPASAWPIVDRLGDWEGTKKPEEELLQNLDMELFELINVPHELDEWGRRVYNDSGHRIPYCVDEDGNTVMGYEAWYPCSVTGEYEEPDDWRTGRHAHDPAVEDEGEYLKYDERTLYSADSEGNTIVGGYETPHPNSVVSDYEEPQEDVPMFEFEQQRLAEFLAAQDEDLPQFQSDRERIVAWIATSSATDDDGVSVLDYETEDMVAQWYANLEDLESTSPSKAGVLFCSDGSAEKGYVSVPLRRA